MPGYSDVRMPRCPDAQMPGYPDARMPGCIVTQMSRYPDALIPRCPDTYFGVIISFTSIFIACLPNPSIRRFPGIGFLNPELKLIEPDFGAGIGCFSVGIFGMFLSKFKLKVFFDDTGWGFWQYFWGIKRWPEIIVNSRSKPKPNPVPRFSCLWPLVHQPYDSN